MLDAADGDAKGTSVGFDVATTEDLGGPDDAAGVTLGAGLGADVQAAARMATIVAEATRVSDGGISGPLDDVYQSDGRGTPRCYADRLSVCRQPDAATLSVRDSP